MTDPRPCHPTNGRPAAMWLERDPFTLNAPGRALCGSCPERVPCRAGAEERKERWGIWGGKSFFPEDLRMSKTNRKRKVARG